MKNFQNLILLFTCLAIGQHTFAQVKPTPQMQIIGTKAVIDGKKHTVEYLKNVSFKSDMLNVKGAKRVVYNEDTKKVTIYGCKEFTINGKVVCDTKKPKKNIIEYTLGEETAYIY